MIQRTGSHFSALGQNLRARRRDGAYDWGIFEDPADDSRFIEIFFTDSRLEHLRLHRRVTNVKDNAPDQRAAELNKGSRMLMAKDPRVVA